MDGTNICGETIVATMYIHNKYGLSFKELVEDTKRRGGVPKEIVVTVQEARDIIDEMGRLTDTRRDTAFRVVFPKEEGQPRDFVLSRMLTESDLSEEQVVKVLNAWYTKEFAVLFNDIPVRIELQRKSSQVSDKPTSSKNATTRWWHGIFRRNTHSDN